MNNQIPRFENEEERADYARELALKAVADMDPEEAAKWGGTESGVGPDEPVSDGTTSEPGSENEGQVVSVNATAPHTNG